MSEKVNLFLSWSGDSSRQIAEILKEWLFTFSNELDIFFTPDGIEAGRRWSSDLAQKLQDCEIGIFVYTRQNLDSLWMAFEAGALSKRIDTGRVIPLVFGESELNLKQPLAQFQAKRFSEKGILETLESVNNCLTHRKTKEEIIRVLNFTWSTLDQKIAQVLKQETESNNALAFESDDKINVGEILNNLYTLIRTSPVYSPSFAKDISELVEQVKTTNRGSYLFIDGEKPAFATLIAATLRAKRHIRSTRFSPMSISGNQDDYGSAIAARVIPRSGSNNCVERYTRIITANHEAKLKDIDGYLEQFPGCRFDLYLTRRSNSFEMVIIDEEELFIHFYDQGQVINSTLHIVGSEVTRNFIDIYQQFHDIKYNPDILKIDFEYMTREMVKDWRAKIRDFFQSSQ